MQKDARYSVENGPGTQEEPFKPSSSSSTPCCVKFLIVVLVLGLIAAVVCAIYFGVNRPKQADADPCVHMNCPHECSVTDDKGVCTCPAGYTWDKAGRTCKDVDECAGGSHGCEQMCINTDGSFTCSCYESFRLADDKKSCILECEVSESPVVQTKFGPVRGKKDVAEKIGGVVQTFLGIPFAAPPTGDLRFRKPQDPEPWNETMDCTVDGNICMQSSDPDFPLPYDEDCLNLNIYVPPCTKPGSKHVMVFIYGGAFSNGANIYYPGQHLAGMFDVVVVVPNYRVNIFGFASTEDSASPGNYGLWDQVKALEWVRDNIAAFGGNPDSVTIFGESAGSASVGYMVILPQTAGLFHKAIYQSGTETAPFALSVTPSAQLNRVAQLANCTSSDTSAMMDCLRKVDAEMLVYYTAATTKWNSGQGFVPCVDGDLLPDTPMKMRQSSFNKVPIIMGVTEDEMSTFIAQSYPQALENGISRDVFKGFINRWVKSYAPFWPNTSDSRAIINALEFQYTHWPDPANNSWNRAMMSKMLADFTFLVPAYQTAKSQSEEADIYFYVFGYVSKALTSPEWFGAVHAIELDHVFGVPFRDLEAPVGFSTIGVPVDRFSDQDRDFSYLIMKLWTDFAKYGNPTPDAVKNPVNKEGKITWPKFEAATDNQYLYLGDEEISIRTQYRQQYIAFWEQYFNTLLHGECPMCI